MPASKNEKTKNIGFRLPQYLAERLEEKAAENNGTVSDFVRAIVVRELTNEEAPDERIASEIRRVEERILSALADANEQRARATKILLTDAGQAEPADADAWVDECLREGGNDLDGEGAIA